MLPGQILSITRRLGALHPVAKSHGISTVSPSFTITRGTQLQCFLILMPLSRCHPCAWGCDFTHALGLKESQRPGSRLLGFALRGRCVLVQLPDRSADLDVLGLCCLGIKILVGTPVTCIEADDDTAWSCLQRAKAVKRLQRCCCNFTSPQLFWRLATLESSASP